MTSVYSANAVLCFNTQSCHSSDTNCCPASLEQRDLKPSIHRIMDAYWYWQNKAVGSEAIYSSHHGCLLVLAKQSGRIRALSGHFQNVEPNYGNRNVAAEIGQTKGSVLETTATPYDHDEDSSPFFILNDIVWSFLAGNPDAQEGPLYQWG